MIFNFVKTGVAGVETENAWRIMVLVYGSMRWSYIRERVTPFGAMLISQPKNIFTYIYVEWVEKYIKRIPY